MKRRMRMWDVERKNEGRRKIEGWKREGFETKKRKRNENEEEE